MTTRPIAAKVPNVNSYREKRGIIDDPDVNIGRFLDNAQNRNLRQVSRAFNQAFLDNLKCMGSSSFAGRSRKKKP